RLAELFACFEHDLHADANAKHGTPGFDELTDRIAMAEDIHGTHTFGKRSDPGDHKTLCGDRVPGVLGNTHVGACVLKRTRDVEHVAHAVIEQCDLRGHQICLTANPALSAAARMSPS